MAITKTKMPLINAHNLYLFGIPYPCSCAIMAALPCRAAWLVLMITKIFIHYKMSIITNHFSFTVMTY
jgi:hypothetical protein